MKKIWVLFQPLLLLGIFVFIFQNCSPPFQPSDGTDGHASVGARELAEINYFTEERPRIICGQDGYAFLQRQYINRHCAACHDTNGFAPGRFAQPNNIEGSYFAALITNEQRFREGVLQGPFCGPTCILDERGEVYQGIQEWFDNKSCPNE